MDRLGSVLIHHYSVYLSNSFPSERLLLSQVVVCGDGRELEYGGFRDFENCAIYQDWPMATDYYRSFASGENAGKQQFHEIANLGKTP